MKLLLVSATTAEIGPTLGHFQLKEGPNRLGQLDITVLISGVGMVATAYGMATALARDHFDLAVNAGIAGSFEPSFPIGTVVNVHTDCLSELGAEDGETFIPIDQLGFGSGCTHALPFPADIRSVITLPGASAITVNKVHGCAESIQHTRERLNPQVESMEGAAFFYACGQHNLSSLQLRSISNRVEPRCKDNWNIPLAVANLNSVLINLLKEFYEA